MATRKRTPAKRTPKSKPRATAKVRTAIKPAALARMGELDALFAMPNARSAYKWLWAASDYGHDEADDLIGDVLEVTSMRYDDSRYETAAAHWELGAAYLEGADGLPRDL